MVYKIPALLWGCAAKPKATAQKESPLLPDPAGGPGGTAVARAPAHGEQHPAWEGSQTHRDSNARSANRLGNTRHRVPSCVLAGAGQSREGLGGFPESRTNSALRFPAETAPVNGALQLGGDEEGEHGGGHRALAGAGGYGSSLARGRA